MLCRQHGAMLTDAERAIGHRLNGGHPPLTPAAWGTPDPFTVQKPADPADYYYLTMTCCIYLNGTPTPSNPCFPPAEQQNKK